MSHAMSMTTMERADPPQSGTAFRTPKRFATKEAAERPAGFGVRARPRRFFSYAGGYWQARTAGLRAKTAFPDKRTQAFDAPKFIQISNIQQLTHKKDMRLRKQHDEKRTQALPINESENQ
jgi:hypothetical protein